MCKVNYKKEIEELIIKASKIAGKKLTNKVFFIKYQIKGHTPEKLPKNKMAVYTFVYNGTFLKIGKANVRSNARYQSQHYYLKSNTSTLANSLLKDENMSNFITEQNVTQWIKDNCERYDVIINHECGKEALNFVESLLHYKYTPKYEFKK